MVSILRLVDLSLKHHPSGTMEASTEGFNPSFGGFISKTLLAPDLRPEG